MNLLNEGGTDALSGECVVMHNPRSGRRRWGSWLASPLAGLLAAALWLLAATPSHAGLRGVEGIPPLRHVFVIVLENKDFSETWGPAGADPYLRTQLAPRGAFAPYYYGVGHLSADNYIALTSGQSPTPPFMGDCISYTACLSSQAARLDGGRNITDQLVGKGLTWKSYMEGMGKPCLHPDLTNATDPYQNGYATRHDPFVYYPDIVGYPPGPLPTAVAPAQDCATHVVDGSQLAADLGSEATTPNLSFIVPDTCDDGHDVCGSIGEEAQLDNWLRRTVPAILASPAYQDRGALFITFDESDITAAPSSQAEYKGCCASGPDGAGLDGGGQVGLLLLSPLARSGTASRVPSDHFSLLRTIEDGFGITEHLNQAGAASEHPLADLFAGGGAR